MAWVIDSFYFGKHTVDLPEDWDADGVWEAVTDSITVYWED